MIGFLNIYKPKNMNSTFVVNKVKKMLKIKKVGHMGTLDPMAEGVLPIAVGNATRMFDYFLFKKKTYIATFEFGYETDTLDADGEKVSFNHFIPTLDEIKKILPSFIGKQSQMPPKYSAKNVNGKRAYDLARNNIDFELNPKEIEIFNIEYLSQDGSTAFTFQIECSSGTYIRSIGRDIAGRLDSLATMTKLIRTKSGKFDIENSVDFDSLNEENILNYLLKIEDVFDLDIIQVDDTQAKKLKNGVAIEYSGEDKNYFVKHGDTLLGIAQNNSDVLKMKTNF